MIISASRRTDIPAFYSEWFYNRIREEYLLTRNPFNSNQVTKVNLNPFDVECIVFWTKNPSPMMEKLDQIKEYKYYFHYTITPYSSKYEPGTPALEERIETFIRLSEMIGKDKVIWRYDPILLSDDIDIEFHARMFNKLAQQLSTHTFRCIISFIDMYKNTQRNTRDLHLWEMDDDTDRVIARELVNIANHYNLELHTCAERIDLSEMGISHGKCIDNDIISRLLKKTINIPKDRNQREECGCIKSLDIGAYNTCTHNCKYCYATNNQPSMDDCSKKHDPKSPFLIGDSSKNDIVSEKNKSGQTYIKL
ncbi:MAG: DUF1848 domain-containing protein [Candidatus Cloacimonadaceae bacterium]|nr:DUF1848 domain-containing protein [Candidatus Cloacimonadaceae bacterium]